VEERLGALISVKVAATHADGFDAHERLAGPWSRAFDLADLNLVWCDYHGCLHPATSMVRP
jgi:hypothetical protein